MQEVKHRVTKSHLCWCLRVCFLSGKSSQWKGTVLDQVPVNPSLYLIKYDGFDCIYGLELYTDERVVGLEVLPDRVGEEPPVMAAAFGEWLVAEISCQPQRHTARRVLMCDCHKLY